MSNCIEQDAPTSRIPQSVGPIVHQAEGVKTRAERRVRRKRGRKGKNMEFAVSGPVCRLVRQQRTVSDIGCRARVPRAGEPHQVLPANALRKENRLRRSRRGTGGLGPRRNPVSTRELEGVRIQGETRVVHSNRITFVSPRCTSSDGHDTALVPLSPSFCPLSPAGPSAGRLQTSPGLHAASNATVVPVVRPALATATLGGARPTVAMDAANTGIFAAAVAMDAMEIPASLQQPLVPVAPAALSFGDGPSGDNPQRTRPPSVWGPRRTFEAPRRREAFCVLAEHFAYDNVDYWSDKSWRPPKGVRRGASPGEESDWPLDAKDVPFIWKLACLKLAEGTPREERVKHALGLISEPEEYAKLRDFSKEAAVTQPRESRAFVRHKDDLLGKRYITPIARARVKQFVTGFTVPKPKKQTLRSILDGRPQNAEQFRPPHTDMAGLEDMRENTLKYALCQELDGVSYFNQFEMHPEIAAHWVIKIGKERFAWNRMPMGWSHAVYVAHTVTELLADVQHPRGVIMVYIDNVYIFGHDREAIDELTVAFLERCKTVNASFEITTPTTDSLVVLGVVCDTKAKTFSLPKPFLDKFEKVSEVLEDCFAAYGNHDGDLPTTEVLWKVFGALMWGTRVLNIHLCRYGSFMNWLSRRASQLAAMPHLWTAPCTIWPAALEDLRRLIGVVLLNEPRSVVVPLESDYDHVMFTDASNTGLGIVHCGAELTRTTSKLWSTNMKATIIAERELYALVEGVREAKASLSEVKKILAYNDNTNVIAWVKRGRGKSSLSNRLIRDLFKLLGSTTLVVEYVASADNIADEPSRRRIQC